MGQVADKPATYADIEALPPNVVGEILFGRLVTHPRPARPHVHASSMLGYELIGPFTKGLNGPGGWHIYDEPEVHVNGHVVVPDIAGWRNERLSDDFDVARFMIAPDWVCEFLSPSTQRHDKGEKRAVYSEIGVTHLWYIDPPARMLEVFTLKNHEWIASHTFLMTTRSLRRHSRLQPSRSVRSGQRIQRQNRHPHPRPTESPQCQRKF